MGRMLFAVIIVGGLVTSICFGYSGGSGEPNDPYRIASKADLLELAGTTTDYNKCFILTAYIDMEGQVFTMAIIAAHTGTGIIFNGTAFTGMFDGDGHKITNFTINGGNYLGLFGYSHGIVRNLGLENLAVSGNYLISGLVGYNDGGSISDCYSTGTVSGPSYAERLGGLVGYNYYGSISNCYSTGTVSGGYSSQYIGGLVSGSYGVIINCYSTGSVSGSKYVGGLVGNIYYGNIIHCHSTADVNGFSYVGGLVGENALGAISQCYSMGAVSGFDYYYNGSWYPSSLIGGLVGYNDGNVVSSYFLLGAGPHNGYGEPLTDEQMKQQASFVGWDFVGETANGTEDIWRMCVDGVYYPKLSWQFLLGDFVCPDGVNSEDLDYFVQRWLLADCTLENNYCGGADMNGSGVVEFADFAIFAQYWLQQD